MARRPPRAHAPCASLCPMGSCPKTADAPSRSLRGLSPEGECEGLGQRVPRTIARCIVEVRGAARCAVLLSDMDPVCKHSGRPWPPAQTALPVLAQG